MSNFGEKLKALREEKKISQSELANTFNLSQSTIAYYEANKKQPNFKTIIQLADYFNVTIDYLLDRTDIKTLSKIIESEPNQTEILAMNIFKELKPEFQEYVLQQINHLLELQEKNNNK